VFLYVITTWLPGPSAAVKSVANSIEEVTITGVTTPVSDPIEGLKAKLKLSPGWSTGDGKPVDETDRVALVAWPAVNRFGVMLNEMPTFVCASALVRGSSLPGPSVASNTVVATTSLATHPRLVNACRFDRAFPRDVLPGCRAA
jgi:hypothetical protein